MTTQEVTINRVVKAIEAIKNGGMVIMVDDEDRENEGDLVFAANHVCPEKINFMTKEARGLICLSLEHSIIDRLKLPMMEDSTKLTSAKTTAFTVSIEAREGVTTGISAADRAHTIKVAVDPKTTPDDIVVPGHIFPLKARSGGVLQRAGHTEGSIDLVRMAGFAPAAVICEIMNDDGTMARMPDLEAFSKKHSIPIVTIADLVNFRLFRESQIDVLGSQMIETGHGTFQGLLFKSKIDDLIHFALINEGDFENEIVDVRVHRQRTLVDVFSHPETGGRFRVEHGIKMLKESKAAVFLYLMVPDGQQDHLDEFESLAKLSPKQKKKSASVNWAEKDQRMLGVGAQILRHLGVRKMRVHMSNPSPLKGLHGFELEVVDTIEMKPT
jgi:3,4-dihydroxy 2-butanone 4-phosphate synthase/GTP cyclohydrolase II